MKRVGTKITTTAVATFEITREELLERFGLQPDARVFVKTSSFTEWDIEDQPIIIVSTITEEREA